MSGDLTGLCLYIYISVDCFFLYFDAESMKNKKEINFNQQSPGAAVICYPKYATNKSSHYFG